MQTGNASKKVARKVFNRCTLFCGDLDCGDHGCYQTNVHPDD